MKTFEIYKYIYEDHCSDSWYGKSSRWDTIGFVTDTEENVKSLVDELNAARNSRFPKTEPEDEWDRDYDDANYIAYREVKISTFDDIRMRLGVTLFARK